MNIENNSRKTKTEKIAKSLKNAKWFIGIGIFLCVIAPLIATQKAFWESFDFSQTGQIGDTIGGITAPIVNIIGAILVFYALKAQIDANRLIQDQFDEQKADELNRKKLLYITEQVNIIRADLNDFTYTFRKDNYKYNYSGADGIYEFLKSIKKGGDHHVEFQEFLNQHPKINELVNLLRIIGKQIEIIQKENISETDKEYFVSLIKYQYESKIQQSITAFRKHKRSDQETCSGCKQKHGIPDNIFDECDKIVNQLSGIKTV